MQRKFNATFIEITEDAINILSNLAVKILILINLLILKFDSGLTNLFGKICHSKWSVAANNNQRIVQKLSVTYLFLYQTFFNEYAICRIDSGSILRMQSVLF
jgi:hypothetical protein